MKPPVKRKARTLLSEFSARIGAETLKVRFYREGRSYVCERELIERDGTSFTTVVPFSDCQTAQTVLASDPYYSQVKLKAKRALASLEGAQAPDDKSPRRSR